MNYIESTILHSIFSNGYDIITMVLDETLRKSGDVLQFI